MVDDKETLNMYPNDSAKLGQDRLKDFVVVPTEWYRTMHSLLSCLHLMGTGNYIPDSELIKVRGKKGLKGYRDALTRIEIPPANLFLMMELIDRDLWDWHTFNEPLNIPRNKFRRFIWLIGRAFRQCIRK